jgi:nucleoid-associated protein YgaU
MTSSKRDAAQPRPWMDDQLSDPDKIKVGQKLKISKTS